MLGGVLIDVYVIVSGETFRRTLNERGRCLLTASLGICFLKETAIIIQLSLKQLTLHGTMARNIFIQQSVGGLAGGGEAVHTCLAMKLT